MVWLDSLLFYLLCIVVLSFLMYKIAGSFNIGKLHEKYVFITGCDSGFGRLLAVRLDKLGLHVFAGCTSDSSVAELRDQCSSRLTAIKVDVARTNDIKHATRLVQKVLGDKPLWGIVNNASILNPALTFEWHTREDYQRVFGVNIFGAIDTTLSLFPFIRKGREGRIVNMSSFAGRFATNATPHVVSNFAMEGFSDGLSKEARAFNITVHTIEPVMFKINNISDVLEASNRERWKTLPKDIKEAYGEEYMNQSLEHQMRNIDEASEDLDMVVDAMVHALTARYPRERYVVGDQAKRFFIPLSFIPCWLQEHYTNGFAHNSENKNMTMLTTVWIWIVEFLSKRANIKLPKPACMEK